MDTYRWHIVPGDMLLFCTDGLVNMVTDDDIKAEFRRNSNAAEIAQRLVTMANENGGKDNITVVVVNVSPAPMRLVYLRIASLLRRRGIGMAWGVGIALFGLISFLAGHVLHPFLKSVLPF